MENPNFVGNNLTILPPGLRFHPTDEEILFEYLRCKVLSLPLPASVIPQVDFLKFDPWDLPGNAEERRYFFWKKEANKRKQKRVTRSGYWKATSSTKQISPPPTQNLMLIQGLKKSYVFCQGKAPKGRRTNWFMHEYNLDFSNCKVDIKVGNWAICNVFMKQRPEEVCDSSSSLHEDYYEYSDNINSMNNNVGPSTYFCPSPTSSSSTSVYKVSPYDSNNYGEGNSYYSP